MTEGLEPESPNLRLSLVGLKLVKGKAEVEHRRQVADEGEAIPTGCVTRTDI